MVGRLDMLIGVHVRKLRRLYSLTLQDLAKASQTSVPTLSRIESGRRSISLRMLQKLACGLRVPLGLLLDAETHLAPTKLQSWKNHSVTSLPPYQHGGLTLEAFVIANTIAKLPEKVVDG